MARVVSHRQTRNGHQLASQEFPSLLDEAVAAPIWRSSCGRSDGKGVDRTHGGGQSPMGRPAHPRRIAQTWNRGFGTNCLASNSQESEATIANVANLSRKSP